MRVLLIGTGYFPHLTAGEKNFFYQLIPLLAEKIDVSVFSLNDHEEELLWQATPAGAVPVFCARRPLHRNRTRFFYPAEGYTAYHHRHGAMWESVEKLTALLFHGSRLRAIARTRQIELVHFLDNFGPGMRVARMLVPRAKVTFAAANYQVRGSRWKYHAYLRASLGGLHAVGVYTDAYRNRLRQMGLKVPLHRIHWGVPLPTDHPDRTETRRRYGVDPDDVMFLWSGWLQQVGERDFWRTAEAASSFAQGRERVKFVFAFKPESFRRQFAGVAGPKIRVVSGVPDFKNLLAAADAFLSPIVDGTSTVSPPLTWLEAMARRTPVVTTNVGGVDEIIQNDITGYVASSYDSLEETMGRVLDDERRREIGRAAADVVGRRFTLDEACRSHMDFWNRVLT